MVIESNSHERADVTTQVLKVTDHLKLSDCCYFHTNSLPRVMGILNVTPDSFSDGGCYLNLEAAISRAREMVRQGASLVDVGGESTRPGALPVSVDEELARVIPVVEALSASTDTLISVDTSKPEVMTAAAQAGAHLINDVKALRVPGALEAVAKTDLSICLMHMQGESLDMQHNPVYDRVVDEVMEFLRQRLNACIQHGIALERCLIDPGFGFGKTLEHNIALLRRLSVFQSLKVPLLIGVSRKSMIGKMLDAPLENRLYGGLGLAAWAVVQGAKIIRTHDVKETVDVLKVLNEVMACPNES